MGRRDVPTQLRAIPRAFISNLVWEGDAAELPPSECDKFRKVLRLGTGDSIALLPGDGRLLRCRLEGKSAVLEQEIALDTEPKIDVCLAQALPKGDKLDSIVKMAAELGVSRFLLFPSERSVVKWPEQKVAEKMRRFSAIAREACEVSFRAKLPQFDTAKDLAAVLKQEPNSVVLSESQTVVAGLENTQQQMTIVVGPEGGWTPREIVLIGGRAVTLGKRVLRVETAAIAACALILCGQ